MAHVVCLIADPDRAPLAPDLVAEVAGVVGGGATWLADREAAEIVTEISDRRQLITRARMVIGDRPIDLGVVATEDRVKRLIVSDMDSTMITVECIDELADYLGVKGQVAAITTRAMNGEIDFVAALEARVALLEGLAVEVFDQVYRERVRLMPGAEILLRTLRARGVRSALVSGGFVPFAERVSASLGFDLTQANRLESLNGFLTGRLLGPIRTPASKLALLRQLTRILHLRPTQTLAVGDGANDLPMLRAAGLGVAYHAHPAVAESAAVAIKAADLTALLYLQGIPRAEFVRA